MKKLFAFIFCIVLTFALVACNKRDDNKNDDKAAEKSITVNFETNGGSAIASQTLKLDAEGKVSFTLPADPLKSGFDFAGWYLDSSFTTEFKSLDLTKDSVTLYAKWVEEKTNPIDELLPGVVVPNLVPNYKLGAEDGLNNELELTVNAKLNNEDVLKLDLLVAVKSEKLVAEDLKDIDLALELTLKDFFVKADEEEPINEEEGDYYEEDGGFDPAILQMFLNQTIKLYIDGGVAYLEIPGAFLGAEQSMVLSANLETVANALKEKLAALVSVVPGLGDAELPSDPDALMEELQEALTELMGKLQEAGLTDELVSNVKLLLLSLVPMPTVAGNKTTYAIDDAFLDRALDNIYTFFETNFDAIVNLVHNAAEMFAGEDIGYPNAEDKTRILEEAREGFSEIKDHINLGANSLTINKNDKDEIVGAEGKLDVSVLTEQREYDNGDWVVVGTDTYKVTGQGDVALTETKLSANLELALTSPYVNGSLKENFAAEKKSDTKVTLTYSLEVNAESNGESVLQARATVAAESEVLDKELKNKLTLTVDAMGQNLSAEVNLNLKDNGAYTKVAFEGKEFATDMTDSLVAALDSLLANLLGGDSSDYDYE